MNNYIGTAGLILFFGIILFFIFLVLNFNLFLSGAFALLILFIFFHLISRGI